MTVCAAVFACTHNLAASGMRSVANRFERRGSRRVEDTAVNVEMGAVTRAIPAALERIEMHRAADVGTGRRYLMDFAFVVAVGRDIRHAVADQSALSGPERVFGRVQRSPKMLGEAFDRRGIFRQECPGGLHADARRIIEL